jgi:hypothetical protein
VVIKNIFPPVCAGYIVTAQAVFTKQYSWKSIYGALTVRGERLLTQVAQWIWKGNKYHGMIKNIRLTVNIFRLDYPASSSKTHVYQ